MYSMLNLKYIEVAYISFVKSADLICGVLFMLKYPVRPPSCASLLQTLMFYVQRLCHDFEHTKKTHSECSLFKSHVVLNRILEISSLSSHPRRVYPHCVLFVSKLFKIR